MSHTEPTLLSLPYEIAVFNPEELTQICREALKHQFIFCGSFNGHHEKIIDCCQRWKKQNKPSQGIISDFCDVVVESGKTFLAEQSIFGHFAILKKEFDRKLEDGLPELGDNTFERFCLATAEDLATRVLYEYLQVKMPEYKWRLIEGFDEENQRLIVKGEPEIVSVQNCLAVQEIKFLCPKHISHLFV